MSQYVDLPATGDRHWRAPVVLTVQLPLSNNSIGDVRLAEDTNTIYVWNGSSWIAVATPGAAIAIDGLISDVLATGPGVVTATVAFVGGSSAASVHTAELLANAATSLNTASTIVRRDASGNFAAGTITASLLGSSTTFTGALIGDVTGIQGATVVSLVGGSSAASVNTATTLVNTAQSGNKVLASPANGSSGAPAFRALVSADIPALAYVTSVALTVPSFLSVAGSPITSSGTLAVTLATQSANTVLAGPTTGGAAAPTFRALVQADLPAFTVSTINSNTSGALDVVYLVDTSGGAFNFTLPVPVSGHRIVIKDKTGSFQTNNLSVLQHTSELIEGLAATKILQTNWGAWSFFTDGTNWYLGPN